ncbi:hypothetical protein CSB09_00165 [Candidatus Gracilibacteria bacterium]|nr:MAG: hypothetical protein CSB09_00165 [Candidatus Gracilibacteria bacterium]
MQNITIKGETILKTIYFFFFFYILVVLYSKFVLHFEFWEIGNENLQWEYFINVVPFHTIQEYTTFTPPAQLIDAWGWEKAYDFWHDDAIENAIKEIGGNIVSFIPLGIFLGIFQTIFEKFSWKKVFFFAIIGIIFLEVSQLLFVFIFYKLNLPGIQFEGRFDVDDILLNSTGFLIGYLLYTLLYPSVQRFFKK